MVEYFYIFIVVLVGSIIQGVSGFGIILISIPLLSLIFDIKFLVPLICLCGVTLNMMISFQFRKNIDKKTVVRLLIASMLGLPLGVYALKNFPENFLLLTLGTIILIFLAFRHATRHHEKIELHTNWAYLSGFLGGVCGGSIGANGPPIIMYLLMLQWDRDTTKATMVTYFLLASFANSLSHYLGGLITTDVLLALLVAVPATVLGKVISTRIYARINEAQTRGFVTVLVFCLGVMLIVKSQL